MSSATQPVFVQDAWQSPRNARTLRAYMALRNQEIAQRIKALRESKGSPPQTTVASAIGVGERTYQTWEHGQAKPEYRNLERLAAYYGVSEEYILTGTENARPESPVVVTDNMELGFDEFRQYVRDIRRDIADLSVKIDQITDALGLTGPDASVDALRQARKSARRLAAMTQREREAQ